MTRPLPLAGVRVVSVEQYGAGPFGTLHLADLGADVIKIEDPSSGGDVSRYVPPFQESGDSLFFETFNRNKRSIALDLTTVAGRSVFERLVAGADAVYSNLRGDVPGRLRLQYDDLRSVNPRIVCVSLSGYGMTGRRMAEPAYDYILQGLAGWMSLTGEPDGPPAKSGLSLVDFCGGLVAGQALLAGVLAARRDGVGMDCDVSLFDTAIAMLTYPATWLLSRGLEPARRSHSAHPSLVPFQNFQTADGWLVVACPKEKFWTRLTDALGHPELGADERFRTFDDRRRNEAVLLPLLDAIFVEHPSAHWIEVLSAAGVPCGPVNGVSEALRDPQVADRGLIVETEHPVLGRVRQVASPVRVGEPRREHRRGPRLGEDGDTILRDVLGFEDDEIADLAAGGAFGDQRTAGSSRRSSRG
jgi:crotonobetainyl-CoA:carnitine CoA-transferase CaiB-like acyl-CoA transferase